MRYIIELAYNGAKFCGWQKQPNAISVQEVLEKAINTITASNIEITGCGRTDAGVHARHYVAHFDYDKSIDLEDFSNKLNAVLCKDVAVKKIKKTNEYFHARFSAKKRTYEYYISTKKDVFDYDYSWYFSYNLNIKKMREAADKLYDYSDFTSFSKLHTNVKTNKCKIFNIEIIEKQDKIVFKISADRFLRNMVRAIVGTLIDVGRGKITPADFCNIIEKKDRGLAGQSVPAHGLFLVNVEY